MAPEALEKLMEMTARQEEAPREQLTAREREVLALMAEGLTNRQIADRLTISYSTARFHVSSILGKLGVASRTEAVAVALQQKLLP